MSCDHSPTVRTYAALKDCPLCLRVALEYIASKHEQARAMVESGAHNTTFAIDLSGIAKASLAGKTINPDGSIST